MWSAAARTLLALGRAFARDARLGRSIVYRRLISQVYDPATQLITSNFQDLPCRAILGPASRLGRGPETAATRVVVFKADLGFAPRPGDLVALDGQDQRVKSVEADRSGGLFRLEVEPS